MYTEKHIRYQYTESIYVSHDPGQEINIASWSIPEKISKGVEFLNNTIRTHHPTTAENIFFHVHMKHCQNKPYSGPKISFNKFKRM